MPTMTGKKALLEMLRAEGVRYIFGNPGTSENPFIDGLEDYPDLHYVLVLQEGVAIGMADAYARCTGRASFVSLHIDSGLANGISIMIDALNDGTPMVVTSGNYDIRKLAEGRADPAALVRPVTKWSVEAAHPEQVPSAIRRAFNEANSHPMGPVYVGLSFNAMEGEAEMNIVPSRPVYDSGTPDPEGLERAADLLASAQETVLLLGNRVARGGGVGAAARVAELLGAPVYTARGSEISFPPGHPQYMGYLAPRRRAHRELLQRADAVLVVGADAFPDLFYFSDLTLDETTKLIHIDSKPGAVGRSEPAEIGLLASPGLALAALADALDERLTDEQRATAGRRAAAVAADRAAAREAFDRAARAKWDRSPMSPERMMSELASALPRDVLLVDDTSSHRAVYSHYMAWADASQLISKRSGAIGWGMGATLGAKLANPDRPVLGVIGDGGAMMTCQALWTAANENIPAVMVVLNNGSYRVLKTNMDIYKRDVLQEQEPGSRYLYMDFPTPFDLSVIARGMGVDGERITDPAEVGPAVKRAFASARPALLEMVIDGSV